MLLCRVCFLSLKNVDANANFYNVANDLTNWYLSLCYVATLKHDFCVQYKTLVLACILCWCFSVELFLYIIRVIRKHTNRFSRSVL